MSLSLIMKEHSEAVAAKGWLIAASWGIGEDLMMAADILKVGIGGRSKVMGQRELYLEAF